MHKTALFTAAALALAGVASSQALKFEDVVRNLRNPDPKIRLASVDLLRDAKYPEAIEPIAPLVTDPIDEIQLEAINAELSLFLGQDVRAKRMVGFVIERRQTAVAENIFEMGPTVMWPRPVPAALVSSLLAAFDDDNARVRTEAAYALGAIARPPLEAAQEQALIKALDHYDPAIRAAAARVIGRLNVTAAAPTLIKAINDSQESVRYAAMHALGDIHETTAIQALTDQLTYYRKGEGAWSALDALAKIASPSSVPLFKTYLTDNDPFLRRAAAEGIARTGDRSLYDAISQAATTDDSAMVRVAMCFAMQKLGANYVSRIADMLTSDKVADQVKATLIELGPSIAPQLYSRLQETQPEMRRGAADVLGVIGGPAALPSLQAAVNDKDPDVASAVKRAIARIKAGA